MEQHNELLLAKSKAFDLMMENEQLKVQVEFFRDILGKVATAAQFEGELEPEELIERVRSAFTKE